MSEYSAKSTGSCDPSKSSSGDNKPANMNPSMKGGQELSIKFSVTYTKLAEILQSANVPYLMPDLAYEHCPASVVVTFPVLYGDANGNENSEGSVTAGTQRSSSHGADIFGSENSEGSVTAGTQRSSSHGSDIFGSENSEGSVTAGTQRSSSHGSDIFGSENSEGSVTAGTQRSSSHGSDIFGSENSEGSVTAGTQRSSSHGSDIFGSENSEGSVTAGTQRSSSHGSNIFGSEEDDVLAQVGSPLGSLSGSSGAGRSWGGVEFIVDTGSPPYIVDIAETEEEVHSDAAEAGDAAGNSQDETYNTESEIGVPDEGEMDWASFSQVQQPSVIQDVSFPAVDWQGTSSESVTSPYRKGGDGDAHEAQPEEGDGDAHEAQPEEGDGDAHEAQPEEGDGDAHEAQPEEGDATDEDGDVIMKTHEVASKGRGSKRRTWTLSYEEELAREREARRHYNLRSTRARVERMERLKKAEDPKRKGDGEDGSAPGGSRKRPKR